MTWLLVSIFVAIGGWSTPKPVAVFASESVCITAKAPDTHNIRLTCSKSTLQQPKAELKQNDLFITPKKENYLSQECN